MIRRVNCIATLKEHMIIQFSMSMHLYQTMLLVIIVYAVYVFFLYFRAMEVLDLLLTFQRNIRLKVKFYINKPYYLVTSIVMNRVLFLYHLLCY